LFSVTNTGSNEISLVGGVFGSGLIIGLIISQIAHDVFNKNI